jgi:two-component system, response regulator PdtaR
MLQEASDDDPVPAVVARAILLVEDEVFARLAMADELMEAGFQVIQAGSADEALIVLRSSTKIDLVLTDIRMPGTLDGCHLANLVHANWPTIKVIILSARYIEALATTPADAFVAKPHVLPGLLATIRRILDIRDVDPGKQDGGGGATSW